MKQFLVDGIKYVKSDIDEFTLRQLTIGKVIYGKVLNIMQKNEVKDLENPTQNEGMAMAIEALNLNLENEILALIYFPEGDNGVFNFKTLKDRNEIFKELKVKIMKQCEGSIRDFFTYMSPFFQESILTYMNPTTEPESKETKTIETKPPIEPIKLETEPE